MFKRIVNQFDGGIASHVFIGRQAGRKIGEFLDKFGEDNLTACIEQNLFLGDLLPAKYIGDLKEKCAPHKEMLPYFKDDEVYGWVPQQYRSIIESNPIGKVWAISQIQQARTILTS